jgi:hypothetical protein
MSNPIVLTQAARTAAREAGRRMAGTSMPGLMGCAFSEIAEAGALAAIRTQPEAIDMRGVPQRVRDAAHKRHTKHEWRYGSRILWGKSHVDDRAFARECVNYVLALIEAEDAREAATKVEDPA